MQEMGTMRISVIIPVYNAARFVTEAVSSALAQPETAEVLLIEDGSKDESLAICETLAREHDRVKLITHPEHKNLGAGASRNAGIQAATSDYIAFLDADDTYLPGRFARTRTVINAHEDADGVYETIGAQYEDSSLKEAHLRRMGTEDTGINIDLPPDSLFRALATGKHGHISLVGLVVAKRALSSEFRFDTTLKQCQDSDWILRIARSVRLYGTGSNLPVAIRRVHGANRTLSLSESIYYQRAWLRKCIKQQFFGSNDKYANAYIVARYVSWSWRGALRRLGPVSQPAIVAATGAYLLTHPATLYRILIPVKA